MATARAEVKEETIDESRPKTHRVGISSLQSERVFQHTSKKPKETTVSYPSSHLNSHNNFSLFLKNKDEPKLKVLDNFKTYNRDLT
jgi:hypothetical protein